MSDNATEREIEKKLEIMTHMAKLADSIHVTDNASWNRKREAEQAYMEAYDWLLAHSMQPIYDHELQRYVRIPKNDLNR
jgi:hypothetical protein